MVRTTIPPRSAIVRIAHLESLVLENTLYCRILAVGRKLGLKDNAEGAIAYYFALRILHLFRLSREAILYLFADNLFIPISIRIFECIGGVDLPPMRRVLKFGVRCEDMIPWPFRYVNGCDCLVV